MKPQSVFHPLDGDDRINLARIETPLGIMVAGATGTEICLLEFADEVSLESIAERVHATFKRLTCEGTNTLIVRLTKELNEYFSGRRTAFDLPITYPGTGFQRRVWEGLRRIPYGQTRSYAQLAGEIGMEGACRALGGANGRNRLAILIPCHRVIAADGGIGGYSGGVWRKEKLLEIERS